MLVLLALISSAPAATLTVGPGLAYETLDAAFSAARDGDEIRISPGSYTAAPRSLNARDVTVLADQGAGTVTITLDAGDAWLRLNNALLTLVDLDIDGASRARIATFANRAALTIRGGTVSNVAAPSGQSGGLADVGDGEILLDGVTVTGGSATNGGFIAVRAGLVNLLDSQFSGGQATRGGAMDAGAGTRITILRSTFHDNAAETGAALAFTDATLTIGAADFTQNTGVNGVLACLGTSACTVYDAWFQGNDGQVTLLSDGELAVRGSVACANTAERLVVARAGSVELDGLIAFENTVSDALIDVPVGATATIRHSHLVAGTGGPALRVLGVGTLNSALVAHNTAPAAVVSGVQGSLTTSYSAFWANQAADMDQPLDATDLTADPLLVGLPLGTCDVERLRITWGSPLRNAGDPAVLGLDSQRSDIGGFGGPNVSPRVPFVDDDGDGAGVPYDCDDANITAFPGAAEVACNGVDDDCDPSTLEDGDADSDGVTICAGDCDDTNPAIYPGATDVPGDGIDQDCDGVDGVDPNDTGAPFDPNDRDGDGYPIDVDCDDEDPNINPGALDIADDAIDQDCSGADATGLLIGRYGFRCGCAASGGLGGGLGGALWLGAGLLWTRRRRQPAR